MTLESLRQALADGFDLWAPDHGATSSGVGGLTFHRHLAPTEPDTGFMDASLSLVVQGGKRVMLGDHTFDYGRSEFLLTSVDLPVVAHVTQASAHEPYLGLLLKIDLSAVRALLAVMDHEKLDAQTPLAIARATVTSDLLDPLLRLCRLCERPEEIELFSQAVQREIIYRLIESPIGPRLRALAAIDRASGGVIKALEWMRQNFRERQSTHALADIACMATSTLHRHFRAITAMSPLQYRKHLQLIEARRLMIVSGLDAASAAYDVGYESPTQFSREYRRAFGQPPISSIAGLRPSAPPGALAARL